MRACPACRLSLNAVRHGDVEIDQCAGCHGVFFDPGEAAALLGPAAAPEQWAHGAPARAPDAASPLCPEGHGGMWGYRVAHATASVDAHACGTCRGIWLERAAGRNLVGLVRAMREDEAASGVGQHGVGGWSYVFQLLTGMPIEVWNPVQRRPAALYTLMGTIVAVFVAQLALSGGSAAGMHDVILRFGVVPRDLFAGIDRYTVVTHAFLHVGWVHLLGNLYFMYVFGDNVEDRLGRARFVLLYAAAALAGTLLYAFGHRDSVVPMVGASGAISGLMGAYIVLFPRARFWVVLFFVRFRVRAVWYLLVWVLLQVAMMTLGVSGTAWEAHLGGVACGVLFALAFRRRGVAAWGG